MQIALKNETVFHHRRKMFSYHNALQNHKSNMNGPLFFHSSHANHVHWENFKKVHKVTREHRTRLSLQKPVYWIKALFLCSVSTQSLTFILPSQGRGSGFPGRRRPRGAGLSGRAGRGRARGKNGVNPSINPGVRTAERRLHSEHIANSRLSNESFKCFKISNTLFASFLTRLRSSQ